MTDVPSKKAMTSQFLTVLPPEIRNYIYELVFRCSFMARMESRYLFIEPSTGSEGSFYEIIYRGRVLALLLVNHQVSQEACACFYPKTEFAGEALALKQFLIGIGTYRRNMIRTLHLHIDLYYYGFDDVLRLLLTMQGLWTLMVRISGFRVADQLQNLIDRGILMLTGKFDVRVYAWSSLTYESVTQIEQGFDIWTRKVVWSNAKGDSEWKVHGTD